MKSGCFVVAIGMFLIYAASWATTALIIWAISLCFPFTFSFKLATGVWLILLLLKAFFSRNGKNER